MGAGGWAETYTGVKGGPVLRRLEGSGLGEHVREGGFCPLNLGGGVPFLNLLPPDSLLALALPDALFGRG